MKNLIKFGTIVMLFTFGIFQFTHALENSGATQSWNNNWNHNNNNNWNRWDNWNGWGNRWGGWGGGWNQWNYPWWRQNNNNNNGGAPYSCRVWYDGCNTCARQYPGGPLVCTKLACFAQGQSYCKDYFSRGNNW